jgi:hypothetical protein
MRINADIVQPGETACKSSLLQHLEHYKAVNDGEFSFNAIELVVLKKYNVATSAYGKFQTRRNDWQFYSPNILILQKVSSLIL